MEAQKKERARKMIRAMGEGEEEEWAGSGSDVTSFVLVSNVLLKPEQSSSPADECEGGDEEQTQSISQIPNSFQQFTSPWTTSAIARVYASLRGRRTIKIIFTLPRVPAAARK